MMKSRALMRAAVAATAVAGVAAFAAPAMAVNVGQLVTGTSTSQLSLTAGTPTAFTAFNAGSTGTATGALVATDTSPSWTLKVNDTASSNAGHMQAAATGCSGSEAVLTNPLHSTVSSALGGDSPVSAGVDLSGTLQTVDSASNQLLAASAFTTTYSQTIGASESLLTGCVYTLTATYTIQ